jgi:hypothetical protein
MAHRVGSIRWWLSPTGLVLAGLCFALPFVTVGCDAPGGYGRALPGGTTTYSGADLLVGAEPAVDPEDRIRPPEQRRDDRLAPQPAAIAVVALLGAGVFLTARTVDRRRRRAAAAGVAGAAAAVLVVGQALAEAAVTTRLAEQLTVPMPAGKHAGDFVHTGTGFWLCLALLAAVAVPNAIGWLRLRTRTPAAEHPQPSG